MSVRRKVVVAAAVVSAVALLLWGVSAWLDGRPNPILVAEVPATDDLPAEIQVARARPIPMKVVKMPLKGKPGAPVVTMPFADADAIAVEEKALRAALDAWLAGRKPPPAVAQSWTEEGVESWGIFGASQRCRLVLHARLEPAGGK